MSSYTQAGRDFFDFMETWSTLPHTQVVAFTATQIPGIDQRTFPAELCRNEHNGNRYPHGIQIYPEQELEKVIAETHATTCALAYSDLAYETIQHLAARVNAAGCKFVQLSPKQTWIPSTKPVIAVCATRTGVGTLDCHLCGSVHE
jgi:predicted GTPase